MYTDIKEMYDINKERIQLTYTDENFHREQWASMQDEMNHDKNGIYLEPCYKQFTLILTKSKEKLAGTTQQIPGRLSSPAGKVILVYPKECNICKTYKLKVKKKA